MKAQQLTSIGGLQAPTIGMQAGTIPGTSALQTGIDLNAMMSLMITVMIMVMMMSMMSKATESVAR